ncbi:MAG TPA: VTT domain-containing protein [Burkholderiales bacterium]|nr:VTT domain-containing protein [Burkholderiales bacterium]
MTEITDLLARYGLALVFVNVFLAQIGMPLPAVPLLVVAGAFVAQGQLALAPLIAVTIAASLLGDTPWYVAGRRFGYRILHTLCRVAIEPDSCVKQTENIFERWGVPSLMVAKFIPGFSTVAPPLAGTMKLGFGRFLFFSAVSALLWAGVSIMAGAFFKVEVEWVLGRLDDMGSGALLVIAAVILFYAGIKAVERYLLIRFLRMVRISVEELHDLVAAGAQPVILDARSAMARRQDPRHIPGAIAVDIAAPEAHLGAVPPDREVVVYCS